MAADMSELRDWVAGERGQSLVEIALTLPLLLLVVLGTIDLGRLYAFKIGTMNAANEAAFQAARDPQATADTICQRARTELGVGSSPNPCAAAPITITCARDGIACGNEPVSTVLFQTEGAGGGNVTVTVTYSVPLLTTYLISRALSLNPVPIGATATVVGLRE